MNIAEPKISDVVVEKVTFFLVQPGDAQRFLTQGPFQRLFPPAGSVIDCMEASNWYFHNNLK